MGNNKDDCSKVSKRTKFSGCSWVRKFLAARKRRGVYGRKNPWALSKIFKTRERWDLNRWETARKSVECHGNGQVLSVSRGCGRPRLGWKLLEAEKIVGWDTDHRRPLSTCLGTLAVKLWSTKVIRVTYSQCLAGAELMSKSPRRQVRQNRETERSGERLFSLVQRPWDYETQLCLRLNLFQGFYQATIQVGDLYLRWDKGIHYFNVVLMGRSPFILEQGLLGPGLRGQRKAMDKVIWALLLEALASWQAQDESWIHVSVIALTKVCPREKSTRLSWLNKCKR